MISLRATGAVFPLIILLSGCATNPQNAQDPYEDINRAVYKFNRGADKIILKPIAEGYDYILPELIKDGISNFFGNIEDVTTVANDLLQGKISEAGKDTSRVIINTTVGIGGLFDVAGLAGIKKGNEDFSQTLGVWGVGQGPYIMVPFLGPSTLRGITGLGVDSALFSATNEIDHVPTRLTLTGVDVIETRVGLLPLESTLEDAIDEYAFVRGAYLQREEFKLYDGNVPLPDDEDEFWDDECEEEEDCEEEI
ncbi:MAG: VacJ family lipoprotein [Pseudomonadota bacterium]